MFCFEIITNFCQYADWINEIGNVRGDLTNGRLVPGRDRMERPPAAGSGLQERTKRVNMETYQRRAEQIGNFDLPPRTPQAPRQPVVEPEMINIPVDEFPDEPRPTRKRAIPLIREPESPPLELEEDHVKPKKRKITRSRSVSPAPPLVVGDEDIIMDLPPPLAPVVVPILRCLEPIRAKSPFAPENIYDRLLIVSGLKVLAHFPKIHFFPINELNEMLTPPVFDYFSSWWDFWWCCPHYIHSTFSDSTRSRSLACRPLCCQICF
jgi:hypothetical protein